MSSNKSATAPALRLDQSILGYPSMVKNTRAVVYADPFSPPEDNFFSAIARYHRYRVVGYDSGLEKIVKKAGGDWKKLERSLTRRKCFKPLQFPVSYLETFFEAMGGGEDSSPSLLSVLRTVSLASLYIAPVLCRPEDVSLFRPVTGLVVCSDNPISVENFLRHLRIAEYAMIDFHRKAAVEIKDRWARVRGGGRGVDVGGTGMGGELFSFVKDDIKKRFWRIASYVGPGGEIEGCETGDGVIALVVFSADFFLEHFMGHLADLGISEVDDWLFLSTTPVFVFPAGS